MEWFSAFFFDGLKSPTVMAIPDRNPDNSGIGNTQDLYEFGLPMQVFAGVTLNKRIEESILHSSESFFFRRDCSHAAPFKMY